MGLLLFLELTSLLWKVTIGVRFVTLNEKQNQFIIKSYSKFNFLYLFYNLLLLLLFVGEECGDSVQCTKLLLSMWKYGCNSWDWREYGSEFPSIWPSTSTDWTWHHTQNSWLFFVISMNLPRIDYSYFMLCFCRCVLEKEQFSCFNWGRERRLILSIIIILLFGINLLLHPSKFQESNAEVFGRFWYCILEIEGNSNWIFFVLSLGKQTCGGCLFIFFSHFVKLKWDPLIEYFSLGQLLFLCIFRLSILVVEFKFNWLGHLIMYWSSLVRHTHLLLQKKTYSCCLQLVISAWNENYELIACSNFICHYVYTVKSVLIRREFSWFLTAQNLGGHAFYSICLA